MTYAGADPATGGVLEYCHDLLYLAAAVQALGCLTDKAWLLLLIVSRQRCGAGVVRSGGCRLPRRAGGGRLTCVRGGQRQLAG